MGSNRQKKKNQRTKDARPNGLAPVGQAAYDAAVTITEPRATTDAFSNPVARLGYGTQNLIEASQYPLTRMSQNYTLMNSLWRGNWVVQNIVGMIPEDMTKQWFKVTTNIAREHIDAFDRAQRTTHLRASIVKGMKWGRLYGGAAGIILIEGQNDLAEPLNLDTIMPNSFKGLYIVDRWSGITPGMELISDINDPDYGYPEYYDVSNEVGGSVFHVHHSRVIRFIGRELPHIECVAENYWGESEVEAIYSEVVKHDNISNNLASLTFKAVQDVYEMENVDQLFAMADQQAQARFWNTLQAQTALNSNLGLRVINKGDAIHQYQYTFSGLSDVSDSQILNVAGAARIPVTKLFGRSPAGLNATGESDIQIYDDYIEELRESDFRPIIEKLLPIMALSAWGEIPDDLDFEFESVRTPSETEKAEIAQRKTTSIIEAFNSNLIPQDAAMKELHALSETTGLFANITDKMIEQGDGVWAKDMQQLNDPYMGLLNGIGAEEDVISTTDSMLEDGGPGSGNFGHSGRPGEIGGSGEGGGPSAAGANKFERGFTPANLNKHWIGGESDHSEQYKGYTKGQYAQEALELVQKPVGGGIEGYLDKSGLVARYDTATNNFVKGHPREGIATMFKPKAGIAYFNRRKKLENQGK